MIWDLSNFTIIAKLLFNTTRFYNDCYRVEGYSAQDIFEKTYLTEIGAYNYLIYLKEDPEQALKDLKDGLPRK